MNYGPYQKKMSSRIFFEGDVIDSEQVQRYSTSRTYTRGQQCTDLFTDERGQSSYVLLRCTSDSTSGDWIGESSRNELNMKWTIATGKHSFTKQGSNLDVYVVSFLTKQVKLNGMAAVQIKIPLMTNLTLSPGKYQFGGMDGQSPAKYHMEFDEFNSLEGLVFNVNKETKGTYYLVVEPNYTYSITSNIFSPKLYYYDGDNWKYHWNPIDWEHVKSVKGYNAGKQYKPGNTCIYQFGLYKCLYTTPSSGEPWVPAHWAAVMQDVKQWLDHVDFFYNGKRHKAAYLWTNACINRYSAVNKEYTKNGLTIIIQNGGHKVTITGTPTADTEIEICNSVRCDAKHAYYMDGCPSGESKNTHYLKWGNYYSYAGRCSGGNSGASNKLVLVIKKQSKTSSGKDVYDNDEFIPELNDTACYDSNCNGLIWRRWTAGPGDVETVEMVPSMRTYSYWDNQSTRSSHIEYYRLSEIFGWGDIYGRLGLNYSTGYDYSREPVSVCTGVHQICIISYETLGYIGAFCSKDGINWHRFHDTVPLLPGYDGRRALTGSSWWLKLLIPAPGDGVFMFSYTKHYPSTSGGLYEFNYFIDYLVFDQNGNEIIYQNKCFDEVLYTTYSDTATALVPTIYYPYGNPGTHYFMNLDSNIYAFSHVSAYNDGKSIGKFDYHTYASISRSGLIVRPEEGTWEYQLWIYLYSKITLPVYQEMTFESSLFGAVDGGSYDGLLVQNVMVRWNYSTTRYWTEWEGGREVQKHQTYYESKVEHLAVTLNVQGVYTIEDITTFDFNGLNGASGVNASWNEPIKIQFKHANKKYIIYGGNYDSWNDEILNKCFDIYTTDDGINFDKISSLGKDKVWSVARSSQDSRNETATYNKLEFLTIKAWASNDDYDNIIDKNAYSGTTYFFREYLDGDVSKYKAKGTNFDFGRFVGGFASNILDGSLYMGFYSTWVSPLPREEDRYRDGSAYIMVHFQGPELSTATNFTL